MKTLVIALVVVAALILLTIILALRIVRQYELGVLFRLGQMRGSRAPGWCCARTAAKSPSRREWSRASPPATATAISWSIGAMRTRCSWW